ncbi:hypothetical protein G9A89_011422 [Geosiphon pyriformis]|nr:hypothetical protein G9A89_011422 [Geosiphon pyriformis]
MGSILNYPHDEGKIWRMANAKIEDALPNIETDPEKFHEHYQNLAPTQKEQEQCLEEINTRLYDHCLIPYDFQYCNKCDFIYNLTPYRIYTILKEEEPISSCTSESNSTFNSDSNSDDDDNNGSSSVQNNNSDNNGNLNSDSDSEQYITLLDLSKDQELRWFSDNDEGIMPEHAHDTNAKFDLRYLKKDAIKLEPHSCICIDLKIALEIPTTIVQLASRSSLVNKGISIRKEIINAGYVRNIIAILQNDSEKTYIIEPNKKITQAIFLSLVKIAQLVLVENRKKLRITTREIQGFGLTDRIDVPVNMTEEEIINKGEIISTC